MQQPLIITIPYAKNQKINLNLESYVDYFIYKTGGIDAKINAFLSCFLKEGMVCVDAGAHIGSFTLILAEYMNQQGYIYAFEPQSEIFQRLKDNIELNHLQNVTCTQKGLSAKQEVLNLHLAKVNSHGLTNYGGARIDFSRSDAQPYHFDQTIPIEVIPLDTFFQTEQITRLDFLKIDTEGHEIEVLLGAQKSVAQYKPAVLFEFGAYTLDEIQEKQVQLIHLLQDWNYQLNAIKEDGTLIPIDPLKTPVWDIVATPL